jgi:hypothetical protein
MRFLTSSRFGRSNGQEVFYTIIDAETVRMLAEIFAAKQNARERPFSRERLDV